MTYQELADIVKAIPSGTLSLTQIKESARKAIAREQSIKEEIDSAYRVSDLRNLLLYTRSGEKKKDLVDRYWKSLISSFDVSSSRVFTVMNWKEKFEDVVLKDVESITEEEYREYLKNRKEKKEAFQKALNKPETLEEFETFIRYKGRDNLSADQLAAYEKLIADRTIQRQQEDEKRQAAVKKVEIGDIEFTLKETKHTKKGHDLFVVQLSERVERDKYQELNRKAKQLGGYYSSYAKGGAIPGFQFTTREAAENFMSLKEGSVDRSNRIDSKYETKANKTAARFFTMADDLEAKGRDKINAPRKDNTARRARMAASAEADGQEMVYYAKVLRCIASAIEDGKIKYLAKISSSAQVKELLSLIRQGHIRRMREENIPWGKWEENKDFEKDINFVQFPVPSYHYERILDLARKFEDKKGMKMRARRLYKKAEKVKYEKDKFLVYFTSARMIDQDLRPIVNSITNNFERERFKGPLLSFDRIIKMGLTNLATLKTALRELEECRSGVDALSPEEQRELEIRQLERKFVDDKTPGFFPTPPPLVDRLLELADIEEGDSILEPSAGLGHIADRIAERFPENELKVIEQLYDLREVLEKKNHELIGRDFLEFSGQTFDKIIMNPPFENDQDIDHVRHAYSLLKPGGRLVAIMANNKERSSRKKRQQFLEFIEEAGGYYEKNSEGAFKSAFKPTGVNTITLALDKDESAQLPVIDTAQANPAPFVDDQIKEIAEKVKQVLLDLTDNYFMYSFPGTGGFWITKMGEDVQPEDITLIEQAYIKQGYPRPVVELNNGWIKNMTPGDWQFFIDYYENKPDKPEEKEEPKENLDPEAQKYATLALKLMKDKTGSEYWIEWLTPGSFVLRPEKGKVSPTHLDVIRRVFDDLSLDRPPGLKSSRINMNPEQWRKVIDYYFKKDLPAEKQKLMAKAEAETINKKIAAIHVDEKRFQNREKLNAALVKEIAENFDPNQFDPVVIWFDPEKEKFFLLAGHHRLAGAKKAGRKTVPARIFEGSENEAIKYAKELSNANRTLETPLERSRIYRQMIKDGKPVKQIEDKAKKLEGKNWRYILNLAYLNPDGKIFNALISLADNSDKTTQQNLEKIADWCGEARRQFNVLTNQHEDEIYSFLLDNFASKAKISRKTEWLNKINSIVQALDFDQEKALNLKRIKGKTIGETEYERQMREIDGQIKELEEKSKNLYNRFNSPSHPEFVDPEKTPRYDELHDNWRKADAKLSERLKALRKQKMELMQKKGKMAAGGLAQMDIFAQTVQKVDKEVDEIRKVQRKPEKDPEKVKAELKDVFDKSSEKDYLRYMTQKLARAKADKVEFTEQEIIDLAFMIQPMIQSFAGAFIDMLSTNKRVLAPTFNNLLRWSEKPGQYDLAGVDIAGSAKPTVKARVVKRARIFNLLGIK